jgi:hypothetical protein
MRRGGETIFIFFSLLLIFSFYGCSSKQEEDPTLAKIRSDLQGIIDQDFPLANYSLAQTKLNDIIKEYGQTVLTQDPDLRAKVYFTSVIADTGYQIQEWLKSLSTLLNIVLSGVLPTSLGGAPPFLPLATFLPQEGIVGGVIDGILKSFDGFFQAELRKLAEVQKNPNFVIRYPKVPIRFNLSALGGSDVELVDLKGEYDLGEAYALSALYRVISGVLNTFIALDLNIDVNSRTLDLLKYVSDLFQGSGFQDDPVGMLSNLFAIALDTQKSFLNLSEAERMKSAGRSFGDGFADLLKSLQAMMQETDDQSDDLIAFYKEGQFPRELDPDKRFDSLCNNPNDPSLKGCIYLHLSLGNLFEALSIGFNLKMVPVPISEKYLTSVTNIRDAFYGKSGVRISWRRDISPLAALAVNTLIQSGIVQGLIVVATDLIGSQNNSTDITGQYQGIFDLLQSSIVTPDIIESLLGGLVPDIFEFDVGTYFQNPVPWRNFLPFWKPVTSTGIGSDTKYYWEDSRLLLEYECNDDDGNAYNEPVSGSGSIRKVLILCPEGRAVDLPHHTTEATSWITTADFQSAHSAFLDNLKTEGAFGMPKDCIKSGWFYIPLRDPSLGGILYINLGPLIKDPADFDACPAIKNFYGQTSFVRATNYLLEALVPLLIAQVEGILSALKSGMPIPEIIALSHRGD